MTEQAPEIYYGFSGNLLDIDLTAKKVEILKIDMDIAESFLGGAGYCCRYLYEHLEKDTDPLSPENIMIIMNGPFTLTRAPSFGRFVICAKSPYTDLWGESNCGGFFGPELKKAGWDGIIIRGKSDNPVYMEILNENVEIKDAKNLWGVGTKDTHIILKEKIHKNAKILCIGQGGENLVKFANVNADGRSAGRTGMGAILGAKKLKAIAVKGDKYKPKVANPEKFKSDVRKTLKFNLNSTTTQVLRGYGTSAGVMGAHAAGDLPIKYWSKGEWDKVYDISGEKLKEHHLIKNKSCYGCAIGCGRIVEIKNKKYSFPECEGPEYETIAGFGSMILNDDLESISIANNLCNDYGMDTITISGAIALLFRLYNEHKIFQKDVDGLELTWGNSKALIILIEKTAVREGIGDLIAEGSNAIGKHFDISDEEIATINKLELPYHDPRFSFGMALTYAFSPRGACHMTADTYKAHRASNEIDFTSIGVKKLSLDSIDREKVKSTINLQDYRALYSSMISCMFSNPPPEYMKDMINSLLGFDLNLEEMLLMGERIFNMKRLFNIKMGLTAEDDHVPEVLLKPLKEGATKGKAPNFEKMKALYYELRKWDPKTGKPLPNKLKQLDLDNL